MRQSPALALALALFFQLALFCAPAVQAAPEPRAESAAPSVSADVSAPAAPGIDGALRALDKAQAAHRAMSDGMLRRGDACAQPMREGAIGPGAMAQLRCILGGAKSAKPAPNPSNESAH